MRDCPPALRRTLEAYIANPALLDGLPPGERALREQQLAAMRATRAMRSAASRAGHVVRRQRETQRLIDLLTDPDDPRAVDEIWETFSVKQCELVEAWCRAEEARERDEQP